MGDGDREDDGHEDNGDAECATGSGQLVLFFVVDLGVGDFLEEVCCGVIREWIGQDCLHHQDQVDQAFPECGQVVGYYLLIN